MPVPESSSGCAPISNRMASSAAEIGAEDRALLDRIAARVVELHLEVPAILALESGRPLSLVAGQTMLFFEPIVGALLRLPDYRRFAQLIERREALDQLLTSIEARAEGAAEERRAARAARRAARRNADPPRP